MQAQIINNDARLLQGDIGDLQTQVRFANSTHKECRKLTAAPGNSHASSYHKQRRKAARQHRKPTDSCEICLSQFINNFRNLQQLQVSAMQARITNNDERLGNLQTQVSRTNSTHKVVGNLLQLQVSAMQAQITNNDARLQGDIGNLQNQVRFANSTHKGCRKLTATPGIGHASTYH